MHAKDRQFEQVGPDLPFQLNFGMRSQLVQNHFALMPNSAAMRLDSLRLGFVRDRRAVKRTDAFAKEMKLLGRLSALGHAHRVMELMLEIKIQGQVFDEGDTVFQRIEGFGIAMLFEIDLAISQRGLRLVSLAAHMVQGKSKSRREGSQQDQQRQCMPAATPPLPPSLGQAAVGYPS
jgi:hypothetical protein